MRKPIDDYDLIDMDFDEFIRRGQEAFGLKPRETGKEKEQWTATNC